jgi:hypothetical protein
VARCINERVERVELRQSGAGVEGFETGRDKARQGLFYVDEANEISDWCLCYRCDHLVRGNECIYKTTPSSHVDLV